MLRFFSFLLLATAASNFAHAQQRVLINRTAPGGGSILITAGTPAPMAGPPLLFDPCCHWQDAVVVGVRRDPLSAYAHRVAREYPHGVPVDERGFARWLFRGEYSRRLIGPPVLIVPPALIPPRPPRGIFPIQP